MRKLIYCGLEPYVARYTYQLQEWNREVFDRRGLDYVLVPGETLTNNQSIVTGQVLDAHGRSYFAMSQMMNLVKMMKQGEVTSEDAVYFEDMFQPGIESIPYILNQVAPEFRPRVFARCLAQTIDPDDFVHVWGMNKWMGLYEKMVDTLVKDSGGAILASNEEMVAHLKIAGWESTMYNISGLAFGKREVQSRVESITPFHSRKYRVVFAARWDQEKQPDFFMDLIEHWHDRFRDSFHPVEFAVLSGGPLRSNNQSYMDRTRSLQERGLLKVYENLSKNEYYAILNDSRVLFNCALQDWTSNTLSEADALGCNVLYPAYRSFPEMLGNDPQKMYIPWSIEDATNKLFNHLRYESVDLGKISDYTDKTIDRIIDIIEGKGEHLRRDAVDYRKYAREQKF